MPENNNLKPTTFPMPIRFGEKPTTSFKNNLEAIKVTLVQSPSMSELRKYVPDFATATWEDRAIHHNVDKKFTPSCDEERKLDKLIWMAFNRKILPSVLETIKLNFCFENISYQDLTHIIRYRTATFSVECSGDKWWTHKDAVIPTSIENSTGNYNGNYEEFLNTGIAKDDYLSRYKWLIEQSKELYVDMLDSKKISLLDARYILPRGMETYCWCSIALSDVLNLVNQRIDKQIQPDSDNVLAYRIIQELIRVYPMLSFLFDLHKPAAFYIATARTNRCTNLYVPDEDTDKYEWNRDDYLYKTTRDNVNGTNPALSAINYPFGCILKEVDKSLENTRKQMIDHYGKDFFII